LRLQFLCICEPKLLGSHTVSVKALCNSRCICCRSVLHQISKIKRDRREI